MAAITYCSYRSPLGELLIAATPKGICRIEFDGDEGLTWLSDRFEIFEDPSALSAATGALDDYFAGTARSFEMELDFSHASSFATRVLTALLEVPFGEVTTYGRLAAAAGTSPRAVGGAVGSNPIPIIVPCHRVIAADGSLGGFSGGLDRKRALLAIEGRKGVAGGWEPRRRKRREGVPV